MKRAIAGLLTFKRLRHRRGTRGTADIHTTEMTRCGPRRWECGGQYPSVRSLASRLEAGMTDPSVGDGPIVPSAETDMGMPVAAPQ